MKYRNLKVRSLLAGLIAKFSILLIGLFYSVKQVLGINLGLCALVVNLMVLFLVEYLTSVYYRFQALSDL
ncbi:hypothetical protein EOPP23_07810 [Endozoicomonas sp. OPT23]|nr:hypothetical protein [Endozoicomonas sp. OPT23]